MLPEVHSVVPYLGLIAVVMQTQVGGDTDVPGDQETLQREPRLSGTLSNKRKKCLFWGFQRPGNEATTPSLT